MKNPYSYKKFQWRIKPRPCISTQAQGADRCVNYGATPDYEAFIATLRAAGLYGKHTVVFDPVGGAYAEAAFRAMAPEGRHV